MEQRHRAAKNHWYHETQSRPCPAEVHPLVPAAAQVEDAFLLDCPWPQALHPARHRWLDLARQLANSLLPQRVTVDRLHTLSCYDRLSTALTVAQVCGVQRLCNHYSARLAPEPGPDSSRESNHRLTLITQFARQLAGNPACINNSATRQLLDVGLTEDDVVTFVHIIGFIGFQARVVAALHAINGLPVRWLPGMEVQADAPAALFDAPHDPAGRLALRPLPAEQLTLTQRELLAQATPDNALHALATVLVRDAHHWCLVNGLSAALGNAVYTPLIQLLSARVNGSAPCFATASATAQDATLIASVRHGERAILAWSHSHPGSQAVIDPVLLLIRAPSRFGAAHVGSLTAQGHSADSGFRLLAQTGFEGWCNRLNISLLGPD